MPLETIPPIWKRSERDMAAGQTGNPLHHVVNATTLDLPFIGEVHVNMFGTWPTRLMITQLIAAVVLAAIVIPLARHIAKHRVTHGFLFNLFETIVLFVRDEMARPAIDGEENSHAHEEGHADDHGHGRPSGRLSDRYLPYLLTVFFFILMNNLLGLIPGGASATGNINVTAVWRCRRSRRSFGREVGN